MKKYIFIHNNLAVKLRKVIVVSVKLILLLIVGLLIFAVCSVVAKKATTETYASTAIPVTYAKFENAWQNNYEYSINSSFVDNVQLLKKETTEMTTELTSEIITETPTEETTIAVSQPITQNLGTFNVSHYCLCSICNGGYTTTALGTKITPYRTAAVDPSVIPLGSQIIVNGNTYIAEDTGGYIKGNRIDLCVSTHNEAYDKGRIYTDVYLVK